MNDSETTSPLQVSYSQLQTVDRCEWNWHLTYERKLTPKRKKPRSQQGTQIHTLLAAGYNAVKLGSSYEKAYEQSIMPVVMQLFTEAQESNSSEVLEYTNGSVKLVKRYWEWAEKADHDREILDVEKHFNVLLRTPAGNEFQLEGYIDLVYKTSDRKLWIEDHKSVDQGKFWSEAEMRMDPQMPTYVAALRSMKWPVFGFSYNFLNVWQYAKWEPDEKYFRRFRDYHTTEQLDNMLYNLYDQVDDLVKIQKSDRRKRSLRKDCSWCHNQELCLLSLRGQDTQDYIDAFYEKREKKVP